MIEELDLVALLIDLPDLGLVRGDVGTVVFVHGQHEAFEVEFMTAGGRPLGVETLEQSKVRRVDEDQAILHVANPEKLAA